MFGPPGMLRSQNSQMRWGFHRPPHIPQWRHHGAIGPRGPFRGHQRHNNPRPHYLPGNDNYWCETCDRGFPTEDILNKHKQQHQKCNIDGCQFIAHPKVITKHIQMQHSTGIYKKIANIKNPEDIEKWREERRKRYPTKANVDKKAAQLKEKIDRGEKMGLERSKNHHHRQNTEQDDKTGQGQKRKFNMRNENHLKSKFKRNNPSTPKGKPKPIQNHQTLSIVEDKKLKPFAGILNLHMDSDNEIENDNIELNVQIEDDDCDDFKCTEIKKTPEATEPVVCGALSSLMCDYGSSEEDDKIENVNSAQNTIQSSESIKNNFSNIIQPNADTVNKYLALAKCGVEANENVINKIARNLPTHTEGSVIITQEATPSKNSMNFVQNADQYKQSSSRLEEKTTIKEVTLTSTSAPVDNGETHNDNNDYSDKVKIEVGKQNCASDSGKDYIMKDTILEKTHSQDDSDSGPEEMKIEVRKEDNSANSEKSKTMDVRRKKVVKGRTQINQRRRIKLPSTLLQKLLFKEMQQERNIVLQCIRYIKRNNYFDKNE